MNMETLQEQVKLLQNYIGGFAKLLKDIQSRVKSLEEKQQDPKDDKLMEIMESKKEIDHTLLANSEAVKRIDKEIKGILRDRKKKVESKKEVDDEIKRLDSEIIKLKTENKKNKPREEVLKTGDEKKIDKKCRYFNAGYCKYKEKCRFTHPKEVCPNHLSGNCHEKDCKLRHPKPCKWFNGGTGCRRNESCDFLHVTLVCGEEDNAAQEKVKEVDSFECAGCKYAWSDVTCVVKHSVQNMEIYFCLNCDDWIVDKSVVLQPGLSLFDLT